MLPRVPIPADKFCCPKEAESASGDSNELAELGMTHPMVYCSLYVAVKKSYNEPVQNRSLRTSAPVTLGGVHAYSCRCKVDRKLSLLVYELYGPLNAY